MMVLDGDWVDQQGLRLWTFVSNQGAQRFYQRHGFQEAERTDGARNEEGAPDIQYQWAPAEPSA